MVGVIGRMPIYDIICLITRYTGELLQSSIQKQVVGGCPQMVEIVGAHHCTRWVDGEDIVVVHLR